MDVTRARDEVKARLEKARDEAALIPQLERQLEGLDLFIAFQDAEANGKVFRLPDPPQTHSEDDDTDITELSRPAAILEILEEAGKPLSPSAITERLNRAGRAEDTPHNVSTALARLKKRSKVRNRGYGRWTLPRSRSSQEGTEQRQFGSRL